MIASPQGEALAADLSGIDLSSPDTFVRGWPDEAFRRLRARAPVFWHEERGGPGFFVVSKYHDLMAVSLERTATMRGR